MMTATTTATGSAAATGYHPLKTTKKGSKRLPIGSGNSDYCDDEGFPASFGRILIKSTECLDVIQLPGYTSSLKPGIPIVRGL